VAIFVMPDPNNVDIVFGMSLHAGVAILLKCNYFKYGKFALTLALFIDN